MGLKGSKEISRGKKAPLPQDKLKEKLVWSLISVKTKNEGKEMLREVRKNDERKSTK